MFLKDKNIFDEFKEGTKVFLDGEYGVIVDIDELSTIIRWDTPEERDFEDWFSCWGSFVEMGGKIIDKNYAFTHIEDDGTLKIKK
jgi:hypothetical protein